MTDLNAPIFVAGHRGMVGAALVRLLKARGFLQVITRNRSELDLRDERAVRAFFEKTRPSHIFLAAARVGGILANSQYPVEFLMENLRIEMNVIQSAYETGAKKLLFLGSSCIYPRLAPQPLKEDCLLTSPLEPTNEAYALAKICGVRLCQYYAQQYGANFISVMPTNLYGPGDNYDLQSSHVLPALIRRFHEAHMAGLSQVTLWGTGSPRREFLHVDDLAKACLMLMEIYDSPELINIGCGTDIPIKELAVLIKEIVGFSGELAWDTTKPDGTPRKLMDISKISALGWKPEFDLPSGIKSTYLEWKSQLTP
jgi:GDP-L-fucose synthase